MKIIPTTACETWLVVTDRHIVARATVCGVWSAEPTPTPSTTV
jgi:hypothetical protein